MSIDLGKFSVSLVVEDITKSRAFYESLGFEVFDGQYNHQDTFQLGEGQDWLMLKNGSTRIGLFQGMFEKNALTFHPSDVRAVQAKLKAAGVELLSEADPNTDGPGSAFVIDPDGNPILIDQQ